ncbi:octopine dehydrogenase-like [Dreissena polymorpha]|uniref:Opine dehydrogenase domain-containing protein n=1 Tax=Dreissena polymorpha TaxID=45954 RepID=A0A9D4BGY0_DREPO|nr:octopine dehydrogenase-like [Dreissena polymorpha]KAH3695110.1 hypothetical protein DPMN_082566 [Dreissena polymorpha]
MAKPLKMCVCGGGKSAQVMAVLAASNTDMEVVVLTTFKDEAEQWSKAIDKQDMVVTVKGPDDSSRDLKAKPVSVSKVPGDVVPGSDIIVLAVGAYAHEEYLKAIVGLIDKKAVIVGFPGQAGFEYLCKSLLGELRDQVTIMSFEMSPWVCSLEAFGKKAVITRTAQCLNGSILRGKAIPRKPALMSLQMALGPTPMLKQTKHFLEVLLTSFSFFHPAIMYGKWKDWDGKYLDSEPLFYGNIDESTAQILEECSKEYQAVAFAVSGQRPDINLTELPDIFNWLIQFYKDDIEDGTSLLNAIKSNKVYKDVKHIMQKDRTKYKPDFNCRYLAEDIPYGLVVVRGIAEILEVPMPTCDMLIDWAQGKMNKKYLVDGKLTGDDVKTTRAPQRFGLTTMDEILAGKKKEDSVDVNGLVALTI